MSRKEKDATLSSVTYKLFAAMFDDVVMDHALEAHRYVAHTRMVCPICNKTCNGAHTTNGPSRLIQSSRAGTPSGTPNKQDGGTVYMDCTVCNSSVASNRFAAHLTNCMGLAGARRSGARSNVKAAASSDAGNRSMSPTSDPTVLSDDNVPLKSKSKSKSKKADEAEFNLKRKRGSPQTSPNKKQKQQKGSPLKSDTGSVYKSQSKIPSKLRESSTASFLERSMSPSSRASSPDASAGTPVSSFSQQSPTFSSRGLNAKKPPPKGTGPPKRASKQITPPLPPPPATIIDYMQDDAGEETGSSTDTSDD